MRVKKSIRDALIWLCLLTCFFSAMGVSSAEQSIKAATYEMDRIDISIAPEYLWNAETGIFAEGPDIVKGPVLPYQNATYRKMASEQREGRIRYTSGSGEIQFDQKMKMNVTGRLSMDMPQKSILIETDEVPFSLTFSNGSRRNCQSFQLYNGGMDCLMTRVADVLQTSLVDSCLEADVITLASKPVIVYINDEYWGQYYLREYLDAETICCKEGIPASQCDQVVIFRGSLTAKSEENVRELVSILRQVDDALSHENMEQLTDMIDMDSLIDWLAIKVFFGDPDLTTMISYQVPGEKWKFALTEMDYGLLLSNANPFDRYRETALSGSAQLGTVLFRAVMETEEYRDAFLQRVGYIYQNVTIEKMKIALSECVSMIADEMPHHLARWAQEKDSKIYPEVPTEAEEALAYWQKRVSRMWKGTIERRPACLFEEIRSFFQLSDNEMQRYFGVSYPSWLMTAN